MSLTIQDISSNRLTKTMTATEVKNNFGAVINWTLENQDPIVVESRGVPKVVMMPYGTFQEFLRTREENQRQQALTEWEQLRQEVQARNEDMSDAEVEVIAQEIRDEVLTNIVEARQKKYG